VRSPVSSAVAPFADDVADVVQRCLMMKSREGYEFVTAALSGTILSLIQVSPSERRSVPFTTDAPVSERLYIRHWGASCRMRDLNVRWNIPEVAHLEMAEKLLQRFLLPILDELTRFARKDIFIDR
jgi:hypothetical protein